MGIFSGKTAIVTGAASGIGKALAEELTRRKAHVTLVDVNASLLDGVAGSIQKAGHQAKAVPLDVSDFESVQKLVSNTIADNGKLDYMFNNAGIAVGGEARDCGIDDWRCVLDVNLHGVVNGVASAYPMMVEQGFGHIVNTASIEGLIPFPGTISYVASKYAVVGLSNALRIEGKELGVKVSVVCPGYVKTPIFHVSKMIKLDRDKLLEMLPDRFGITPEKCALAILKGVEKNKAIIVVTSFAKFLWLLNRIHPGLVRWLMGRRLKESRQEIRIET